MSERARQRAHAEAAAEAVKAYVRMNRVRLARDGELLALLVPERFPDNDVRDLQRHIIEKIAQENAQLRAERDRLHHARVLASQLGEGVRQAVLDLVDARSFEEVIQVAKATGKNFGAERAAICVEGEESARPKGAVGVRLIGPGIAAAVLGRDGKEVVLSGGGSLLLGPGGAECRSIAAFRLVIGEPAALYVLGSRESRRFESGHQLSDLSFFARALERAIRAWLDLPKL